MITHRSYLAYLEANEEGGYTAVVPSFDDAATFGKTYEEAIAKAEEMLQGYIELYRQEGIPLPVESSSQVTTLLTVPLGDKSTV